MTEEKFREQLIHSLFKEYQSVWLVDIRDKTVRLYWLNETNIVLNVREAIEKIHEVVDRISDYDHIRSWYIDHFIDEKLKRRVFEQTDFEIVLKMTADGSPYFVNYGRVIYDTENYNQLCFDRLNNDEGETEYLVKIFSDLEEWLNQ